MYHGKEETFVFLSDVLELRLRFMNHNSPDWSYYQQQLDNEHNNEEVKQMVQLQDFQMLIDDGVIDQDFIRLIEDSEFKQKRDTFWNELQGWVKLRNHTSEHYCFPHHALLQIFKRFVCGFRWDEQMCKDHTDCLENFKIHINNLIGKYNRMPSATVVHVKTLFSEIVNLAKHCSYKKQRVSRDKKLLLDGHSLYEHYCDREFEKTCQMFGFVNFRQSNHVGFGKQNTTVYATRVYYLLEWAKSFSDGVLQVFATILIYGVFPLCPRNRWKYLPGILEHRFAFYMSLRDTFNMPEIDCVEEEDVVVDGESGARNETTSEEKNDEDIAQNTEVEKENQPQKSIPFSRLQQKLHGLPDDFSQLLATDRCIQCFANIGERKKAESELREWKKKANLYEKQSNKYEELEKEYAKMKGKFENACKKNLEHKEKHAKELEEVMKTKPRDELEVELIQLKEKFKEKTHQLNQQAKGLEKMDKLREKVTSQKEIIEKLGESKKSIEKSQALLQNRATENTKKVGDLERTVQNQETLIEQLTEANQSLHEEKNVLKKQIASNEAQHKQEMDRMNQQINVIIDQVEDKNRKQIKEKDKKIQHLEQELYRLRTNRKNSMPSNSSQSASSSNLSLNQIKKLSSFELEEDECAFCWEPIGHQELFNCVNPNCPPIHNKCMQEYFKRSGQLFHQVCGQCQNMVKDTKNFPGISG
ncbi:unnamed protein product [Caenorhabditis brenneri]